MPTATRTYSDLDLNLIPHPLSGDIIPLKDADAIKRAVRNLMLTGYHERPFRSEVGAHLKQLLFEPITIPTERKIDIAIRDVLRLYEPRITIMKLSINVSPDENGYNVELTFAIDALSEYVTISLFLERVR